MNISFRMCLAALAGAGLILVTACGGGGGTGGTGAAAQSDESVSGTVTGFGSVIVDGVRYDDSTARVVRDDDPSREQEVTSSGIKLGMRVELSSSGSQARTITIGAEVVGRITSLTATGFVVAGQTVQVSADPSSPTVFEGASGLSVLVVGDRVEVHGQRDAPGVVIASRIERRSASALPFVRVVGSVSALDATGSVFSLGGLTVGYSGAIVLPAGAALANGQRVVVWSDVAPVGDRLTAKVVRIKRVQAVENDRMRVGGRILAVDLAARTFTIDGLPVDASGATFNRGTAADLINGRRVQVRGTWANGRLVASEVRFFRDQGDGEAEMTGVIANHVGVASFTVRGVPVDASGAGVEFKNGTAATLANGVAVKIHGSVDGGVVKAREVEFLAAGTVPAGGQASDGSIEGAIYDVSTEQRAFRLNGALIRWSTATVFDDGSSQALTNGALVEVHGSVVNGEVIATRIEFKG